MNIARWVASGIIIISFYADACGQGNLSKVQLRDLEEASIYMNLADYQSALGIYERLLKVDSSNAELNFGMGYCIFMLRKDKLKSLPYFRSAHSHHHPEAAYFIARCLNLQERFDEAVKYYIIYKSNPNKRLITNKETDRQIDISLRAQLFKQHPVEVRIENLGAPVNTPYPEYVPLITGDGSELIFTSRRKGSTGGKLDPYNDYYEDIYHSLKSGDTWTEPTKLGSAVNSPTHDACVGLSAGGKLLLIYRTNETQVGGDLYWSERKGEKWSEPVRFGPEVNTEFQEPSATITDDGIVMYFSSNRPGGYGGKDIYRIVKFGNGDWSLPLNLGPVINTAYDDDAPFIHPDNKTLYFSSKGHKTIGGYDIFKSELIEDRLWSLPVNLGYPINTVDDDIYFSISKDRKTGYYSSARSGGFGRQDIYMLHMPDESPKLLVMKGRVTCRHDTMGKARPKMTLLDEKAHTVHGVYRPNALTGKYIMILKPGTKYRLIVEASEYLTHTETIYLPRQEPFTEVNKDIELLPVHRNSAATEKIKYKYTYTLENVYFDTEKHELLPGSYSAFISLIRAMQANRDMLIEIAGHTDEQGDAQYNMQLSQKRADSVREYLITKGIAPERLIARGYGETQSIADNSTESGRALNRRTEIRVIKE